MRYHNRTKDDMLNGDGLRVVLWGAGCNHCCRDKDYISGITFSGGDPLHPSNISAVTALARKIRTKYPDKTIWLYTGSRWEEIQQEEIVRYLDVLVDGEFQVDKLDQSLKWKGSSNQRVINVPATLREQKIVLHAD